MHDNQGKGFLVLDSSDELNSENKLHLVQSKTKHTEVQSLGAAADFTLCYCFQQE